MRRFSIGFVAGVLLLQQQAVLPGWYEYLLGALAGAALAVVWRRRLLWARGAPLLLSGMAALAGFFWAALMAQLALLTPLAQADEGRDLLVEGIVESLPYRSADVVRCDFRIEHIYSDTHQTIPQRVALGWYASQGRHPGPPPELEPGQRWRLQLRLTRPHGQANPHGFDYEVWLLEQGIGASAVVRHSRAPLLLDAFVPCGSCVINAGRAALRVRILRVLDGRPYAGVIVALVLGDQRGISRGGVH
ncbi:DUF4131 domain-containing protein [Pseudoduganella sp. FT93W]|uniref:DUF4131 domain-containing protein n=1 Tax=Duganella fentianensis TaxID=2692177 RepID=A0A845I1Z6_9BURK|nr:ComEC/Rec2 family competence protein [Duganella fentianensis]MYN47560.1 DUF4131 domain-containing protein [Duganella fentianensis]